MPNHFETWFHVEDISSHAVVLQHLSSSLLPFVSLYMHKLCVVLFDRKRGLLLCRVRIRAGWDDIYDCRIGKCDKSLFDESLIFKIPDFSTLVSGVLVECRGRRKFCFVSGQKTADLFHKVINFLNKNLYFSYWFLDFLITLLRSALCRA